jgi:capsular exopolysaccharide synthesis family protein
MELGSLLAPLTKWWRLIVLAALIAAVSTVVGTTVQPKIYIARTTLIVGQSINNPNPSSPQFYLEQELAKIYADVVVREPIRRATMEALGMEWLPSYVARALPNTQLLEIAVSDTSPRRAQAVAAELANQLILSSPGGANSEELQRSSFTDEQLSSLQEDITATEDDIAGLEAQLGDLRGAGEIAELERQIAGLEDKLRTLQSTYARLLAGTPQGAVNSLTIIERAEVPAAPTGPNRGLSIVLAAALGASVAAVGAYAIEFLDRRLNHPSEVLRVLGWPVIGEIAVMPEEEDAAAFVSNQPHSAIANSFRTLKANLELAGLGSTFKTLLVTGPAVGEGKSTVAQNLALTLAMAQRKAILVDGDSHHPQLRYSDRKGLSDLLLEGGEPADYLVPQGKGQLLVLPAGSTPLKASNLLDTTNLRKILLSLKQIADVIIIDGPPSFVADALVIGATADGVLAVVRLGQSPWEAAVQMKAQFRAASINVEGVVLNGVSRKPTYYSSYYEQPATPRQQTAWRAAVQWIWDGLESLRSRPRAAGERPAKGQEGSLLAGAVGRIMGQRAGGWTAPVDDDKRP